METKYYGMIFCTCRRELRACQFPINVDTIQEDGTTLRLQGYINVSELTTDHLPRFTEGGPDINELIEELELHGVYADVNDIWAAIDHIAPWWKP